MPSRKSERGQPMTYDETKGTNLRFTFYFTAFRAEKQCFPVIIRRSGAPEFVGG
jgi:hypothetical protein